MTPGYPQVGVAGPIDPVSDFQHPELDFDPLDDTTVSPNNELPPQPVGRMVLNQMPGNFLAETNRPRLADCSKPGSPTTTRRGRLISGRPTRARIPGTNDYIQAGQRTC